MTSLVAPAARRSPWLGFLVLGGIEFLTVMDAAVVNIALPVIKEDLRFSPSTIAWVVNCYLIPFAGVLLLAGRLGDVLGHRRLFLSGTALFTLASAGCGFAAAPWQLLLGRTVQGLGAALVVPAALALITGLFAEGPGRNRALAIFGGMGGLAAPVGLVVGGLLAGVDWTMIFWVNVPLGVVVLLVARAVLPAPANTPARLDVAGAVAATGALSLLAFAAASLESPSPLTVTLAGAGAVLFGAVFVLRQRKAEHPLIPGSVLRLRSVTVGSGIFVLVGTILFATFYIVTLYLQDVRGLAPLEATLVYLPLPLAVFVGTQLAPRLVARLTARNALALGLGVQGAALVGWAMTSTETGSLLTGLIAPATPWGFGLGLSIVSSFVVCTSGVAGPAAGAASGVATSAYQGGGAVGLAAVAALAATGTSRVAAGAAVDGPALLAGYHLAMWTLAAVAAVGVVLTRALPAASAR
ncbi:MFS transporter [Saccharothrix sp. NRRL B-16314]|uniref:MFS transporter n=1 Tax=Saccharothrix sp. NRRL B-16314 TaxID=1463825 RepID=UPI0012DF4F32|nr:MFS transporter [Saccharothrix sp. NRRL B-16314]